MGGAEDDAEAALYRWLCEQRRVHRRGRLPQERRKLLQSQHPYVESFVNGKLEQRWSHVCGEVESFIHNAGILPSSSKKTAQESALRSWLQRQRQAYRQGRLSPERAARMKEHP